MKGSSNMTKSKKILITIFVSLSLVVGIITLVVIWYPTRSTRSYTGCVMSARENSIIVYFDVPECDLKSEILSGSLYMVVNNDRKGSWDSRPEFISSDDSIKSFTDLQKGMLVDIKFKDIQYMRDMVAYEPYRPVMPDLSTPVRIKTDGEMDDELFELGVEAYSYYGYDYVDGGFTLKEVE